MEAPSIEDIEKADWATLKRYCGELGLSHKGKSTLIRRRLIQFLESESQAEERALAPVHLPAILNSLGKWDGALGFWQRLVATEDPAVWMGLGTTYLLACDFATARRCFEQAVKAGGGRAAVLQLVETVLSAGDHAQALSILNEHIGKAPQDLLLLLRRLLLLQREGRQSDYVLDLDNMLRIAPEVPELWNLRGVAHIQSSSPDRALECFRTAKNLDTEDAVYWNNVGVTLITIGRVPEAIGFLEEAVARDGRYSDALNNLGVAYLREGKLTKATEMLSQAVRVDKRSRYLVNLAYAWSKRKNGRSKALRYLKQALEKDPANKEAAALMSGIQRRSRAARVSA